MGLVLHVVDHTAQARAVQLSSVDREDLVSEVFLALVADDVRVLRLFRGDSSLATYLTVIARRVVVRQLSHKLNEHRHFEASGSAREVARAGQVSSGEQRINDRDELERLMARLHGAEADVVRLYHLEGKSYREISAAVGLPENTIGPTLSRARSKMRQASPDPTVS
jgi:RNA polymerase sigma-70 factor (ECF subfamily)